MTSVKRNSAILIFIVAGCFSMKAQSLSPEVISAAGDFLTSTAGSVSYTIGEPLSETFSATPNVLTQGFQQPFVVSLTGILESSPGQDVVYTYPNPVKDELMIDFAKIGAGSYLLKIVDAQGKEIENKKIEPGTSPLQEKISFSAYQNGIYFIRVISADQTFSRTFKIVKQN